MSRVAAIGLDAFEWWFARRLMDAGRMPHLRALTEQSAVVELENVVENRSEIAWVQLLTGQGAAELKWPGQLRFDPLDYRPFGHGTLDPITPFYQGIKRKTIAFDVMHATVAPDVEGVQVTAWGAHSPQYWRASDPAGLLTEVDRRFGTNPAFGNDSELCWYEPDYIDNLADAAMVGTKRRVDIIEWLTAEHLDWDLLITCMSEIHGLGHNFWHGVDATHPLHETAATTALAKQRMEDVCVETDRALGRFLDLLPEDATVVVFSLHGMQPADDLPASVLLPELLHRQHVGQPALRSPDVDGWRSAGCPPVDPGRHQTWHGYMRRRFTAGPRDRLRHAINRMPSPIYQMGRRVAGKEPANPLGPLYGASPAETDLSAGSPEWNEAFDWHPAIWYRRWWSNMPWFSLPTFDHSYIRVNLEGRERDGIVPADDYDRACAEAEAAVRGCRDARTGDPVVADVTRLRESDPRDPDAPAGDLLVQWASGADAIEHPDHGVIGPFPHLRTGSHSSNGFALVRGKNIAPGPQPRRSALDLTPTILDLLGCPIPPNMVGFPIHFVGATE
ncbi:MAG: alkaline phosphatase family protein [Acidimicrobiales bacterium]